MKFIKSNSEKCPECGNDSKTFMYNAFFLYTDTVYYTCNTCNIIYYKGATDKFYIIENEEGIQQVWINSPWFIAATDKEALAVAQSEVKNFRKLNRISGPYDDWQNHVMYTMDFRDLHPFDELQVEDIEGFEEEERLHG
mgnify:CR=1 FL=1